MTSEVSDIRSNIQPSGIGGARGDRGPDHHRSGERMAYLYKVAVRREKGIAQLNKVVAGKRKEDLNHRGMFFSKFYFFFML